MVQLGSLPSVDTLLSSSVPVESLRNVIGEVTHVTPPSVALVQKGNIRVDVRPAASASGNDLVLDDRYGVLIVVERTVGLDHKRKGQLGFLEERIGGGNSVEGRSEISRGTVGVGGRSNARLKAHVSH
jgi:hypothetical protein